MAISNNSGRRSDKEIFFEAIELATPEERAAFLDGACGRDPLRRQQVEELLANHFETDTFMLEPATDELAAAVPGAPISESPGSRIGRYKLLQKIGEGGMGVVYVAEQQEPVRRRVALKIIKLGMDTEQVVARFEAERQALALMDHPNIAKVLDAGATETGRPYFVMELVQGVPITEFCDSQRLSVENRIRLFIPVCRAIQSAHQKGIIHRDLKPTNILVALSHDGSGLPKVIDFGVAKATSQKLTNKTLFTNYGTMIGTPAYMSPEQAEMSYQDVDTRADIYSLGVLLYELLAGTTPISEKHLRSVGYNEMQRIILEEQPERPSSRLSALPGEQRRVVARNRSVSELTLGRSFPRDLDWVVMKCLEKDRTRRYETANGLANDIERHLRHEPVVARPPSRVYELQKAARRHWVGFAATGAVLTVLAAGVVVSTLEAVHARRAERLGQRLLYAANLNLAQQAWEQNHVGRVRQLLEDTIGHLKRGFEWYYWQRQTHLELKTLRGHLGAVRAVAVSPDGRRIVTGSEDRTALLWDAVNGKELFTLTGHGDRIATVAFSPNGQRIVTVSLDRTAKVWETASGKELFTLKGPGALVVAAAFSANGQRIVTGSLDGTAKVWDAASGNELLILNGHAARINWVGFSPDGQRVVTASGDATAKVWDAANGKELLNLRGHTAPIVSAAISPNSQRIVTASDDGNAKIWDAADGRELFSLTTHRARIVAVAFCPDAQRFVTASADRTAKVWDAASGTELFTLRGHSAPIATVAVSPDGRRIVTGSEDQTARTWETASGKLLFTLKGHSAAVECVAFSPDGQRIVTGSDDQTAKVWEAAADEERLTLKGHSGDILAAAFSPDGRRIITGSADQTAKVWEVASGKALFTLQGHRSPVRSVAFSPDGQRIVTGSGDATAMVWEAASGQELGTLRGHSAAIISVAFSPDGQWIVTGSDDQTAKVWEVASGRQLRELRGHRDGIFAVAISPDGQRIVTGSRDHTAKVWEAASGKLVFTLHHDAGISSIAFSRDGQRIITGSWDRTAKVWDAGNGKELLTLQGHSGEVSTVAFSPDAWRIITGSRDRTAKIWEAASGQELLTLQGHSAYISSVAFSPDGQWIITASGDQTARVWKAATADQVIIWQKKQQEAKDHLAELSRERAAAAQRERALRARDPGAIKQWLVLAPIAYDGRNGAMALSQEQVTHEADLHARAGERIQVGKSERVWRAVTLDDYQVDFNELVDATPVWSVAYAVCYITSKTDQAGLLMNIGSDDQSKVYLNGKEIYRCERARPYIPDQDLVAGVALKAGLNVLVFKVVNETGDWLGSIRFTDAAGQPVQGIQVTLASP